MPTQNIFNLVDTWASGGGPYTSIKMNATDNDAGSASLLMDLQVGGSSRFNVGKTGSLKLGVNPTGTNQAGTNVTIAGSQGTGTGAGGSIVFQVAPAGSSGTAQNALATALTILGTRKIKFYSTTGSGDIDFACPGANIGQFEASGFPLFKVNSSAGAEIYGTYLGWAAYGQTSPDLYLYRDDANKLALRNGANAQFLRVYSTYTDASNYERGAINTGADFVELAAETAGTGDDNLDVRLTPAGTGSVRFGTHTGTTDTAISGYIEIKDAGGTIRKLAVIS